MKKHINILGCGVMGTQISNLFSIMGYEVNVWNRSEIKKDDLFRKRKILSKLLNIDDKNGQINIVKKIEDLQNNITIESLIEDLEVKKKILNSLKGIVKKDIFSNTSSIKTSQIDKNLKLLHFFNPISLKIIEYNKRNTLGVESDQIFKDLKENNFELLEVGDYTGYAFNKILFAQISNFFFLIENEKVDKNDLMKLFKKINNNLNVLNIIDLIGVDTTLKIFRNLKKEYNYYYIPLILDLCLLKKIFGKKNKTSIKSIFDLSNYPKIINNDTK